MTQIYEFNKTPKQAEVIRLMSNHTELLIEGGGRAGKTFIEIYAIIIRMLKYKGSMHLALRKHFNHAKLALFSQTIPNVLEIAFPNVKYKQNKSDYYYELNESQLWIGGTDDKERVEKILGTEWATIFLNEISEQSYSTYELLKTRLNPPRGVKPLMLLDQNPPSTRHWSYIKFHMNMNPENNQPLPKKLQEMQAWFKMVPKDNENNLNETYIQTLEGLSESKKRRFLYGEYTDDTEGALWKIDWITRNRLNDRPSMSRVIVAIDPNVTDDKKVNETTDEAGIITVGQYRIKDDWHYCVIRDDSTPGLSWGAVAVEVFRQENADRIIGEVNQGGDLIEMNIRNYDRYVPFDSVRATRGKEVRAEPIADLYRRGYVHHLDELPELEQELVTWVPGNGRSPNRLDAVVWAISYLSGSGGSNINTVTGW